MTTKRRLINQLPVYNQTDTLKKFFGATVDQLFQPGNSQRIAGYVGRQTSYTDPTTDFYIAEPTSDRSAYSLEPSMVTYDASGNLRNSLVYPDLVKYLEGVGANTSNQQRMFETDFYSWCPPINIDMLVNYHNYYWFGADVENELPILNLVAPVNTYIDNGSHATTYALPNHIPGTIETARAYVNFVKVSFTRSGNNVVLNSPPSTGDIICVTLLSDLALSIRGQTTFNVAALLQPQTLKGERGPDFTNLITPNVTALSSGMKIRLIDTERVFGLWDANFIDPNTGTVYPLPWDQTPWDLPLAIDGDTYFVDGVGQNIRLTPVNRMIQGVDAQYITIDRSSIDANPWSLRNNWVHRDTYLWSGLSFDSYQAQRPVIEFVRDIVLYGWGGGYTFVSSISVIPGTLSPVQAVLSSKYAVLNGTTQIDVPAILTSHAGSVTVDNGVVLANGMSLLIRQSNPISPSYNNQIYTVGISSGNYTLTAVDVQPDVADNVPLSDGAIHTVGTVHVSGYTFDGTNWRITQEWGDQSPPLFMLYDPEGVALDDTTKYPGSDFFGNKVFGFSVGTNAIDPLIKAALSYDSNGYINFENYLTTISYNYDLGVISGIYNPGLTIFPDQSVTIFSDWHPVATVTRQTINSTGEYNLPASLYANANSEDVKTISRSNWTAQFSKILSGQLGFTGVTFGENNYRDTSRDLSLGLSILQTRAPLLKTMLLAANSNYDLIQAIRFADQEYNKFKHKFSRKLLQLRDAGLILDTDSSGNAVPPDAWVGIVLNAMKIDKNNTFPFALSTMAGGTYYIPPTPTSFGISQLYVPQIVTDTAYGTSIQMILGHDGSLTATFGDFRDNAFLALENRIYNQIASNVLAYNAIVNPTVSSDQVPDIETVFSCKTWMNRKYRNTADGYSISEVNLLLNPIFEYWAQINQIDYRANTTFDQSNPFTWNYHGMVDRDGMTLPGNWKAIYNIYYDTFRPHTHPWEMLGFANKPSWWVSIYGNAPYTRSNSDMWNALEAGYIAAGPRNGTDPRYARPGLSAVIPVDFSGNLLNPLTAGIVKTQPSFQMASSDWTAGDMSPVETLWYDSSSYRFALAEISFLMKPNRFVEECWNSFAVGTRNNQWLDLSTNFRPYNRSEQIHGELDANGAPIKVAGIQQWLVDHLTFSGLNSKTLGNDIRGLDVKLVHKMAGFISDDLKTVADNFGLIPAEDVEIAIYNTPSSGTEVYSGVIVEWTGSGWRVVGYDAKNPFFVIIPPDIQGPKGTISLSDLPQPTIYQWFPNTHYLVNIIISYNGSTYKCAKSHTSGKTFEQIYWTAVTGYDTLIPKVTTYSNGIGTTLVVPYGSVFATYQEVADFLLGYERFLVNRGWIFDQLDSNTNVIRNWKASVKEFLEWTQIKWSPGNFIALSPGAEGLKFYAPVGTIMDVENNSTGFFGMLDRSGAPVDRKGVKITRLDGLVTLEASTADIYGARLQIGEVEHALIFNNTTIFNDIIFDPLFDLRQARIRLICLRAGDWAGRLDAPGYVLEGNSMISNFEQTAEDVRLMFDIELANRIDLRDHARHVVGFQSRSYLDNLLLSDTEKFEFYQGMIEQKGAPGVFNKLLRNTRVSQNSNIAFLEEWAILQSVFGPPNDPRVTFALNQSDIRRDPQVIKLTPISNPSEDWIVMATNDARWLDKADNASTFFSTLPMGTVSQVQHAGHVRLTDVTYTAFHNSDLGAIYSASTDAPPGNAVGNASFQTGQTVWIYDYTPTLSWNVLRVFETSTNGSINTISNIVTSTEDVTVTNMRIFFTNAHGLTTANIGQTIVIDALTATVPDIQGIQIITNVNIGSNWIEIGVVGSMGHSYVSAPFINARILSPMRFADRAALAAATSHFVSGDLVYIDHDSTYWTVLQYNGTSWDTVRAQPAYLDSTNIVEGMIYNTGSRIVDRKMFLNEPLIDRLNVIDPINNTLPGIALDELTYTIDYDPAEYNEGFSNTSIDPWGNKQVGQLWWDTSTVRYLNPYTDIIGGSNARDITEINYRATYWSQIAPGTSVDVYEWTKSIVSPTEYNRLSQSDQTGLYQGTVLNADFPSCVQQSEFDPAYGSNITYYYFWVKNRSSVPNVPSRKLDAVSVSRLLQNPSALDIPWIAPITQDTLIISGVSQVLNNTTSTLKVELSSGTDDIVHDQWILLRPNDDTSLPPDWLWEKIRDGLAQFDDSLTSLPYSTIHPYRQIGISNPGQNIFTVTNQDGNRGGLMAARESFVGIINNIFGRSPIRLNRGSYVSSLDRQTFLSNYLIWTRPDYSYSFELPPEIEYDIEVFSTEERNKLLLTPQFIAVVGGSTVIRVLVNGLNSKTPQWSIWKFNNNSANTIVLAGGSMFAQPDVCFDLYTAYDFADTDLTGRNTRNPTVGQRLLVTNVSGPWVIYRYDPMNSLADDHGYVIHRVQSYDTTDFYSFVDWYDTGFSSSRAPSVEYASESIRNSTEGSNPKNLFVKITNGWNSNLWTWTVYNQNTATWSVVAYQQGTIALSSNFYDSSRVIHALDQMNPTDTTYANRDGSWEIRILAEILRFSGILIDAEINEVFFSLLHFIHTQQDEVAWAFKTSFMVMNGYNAVIDQQPVLVADQTENLIDYVNEVKPYHVKIRDFSKQYIPPVDSASVASTDFDRPPYVDPITHQNRILDATVSADQTILSGTKPWSDWNSSVNVAHPELDPIRKLGIGLAPLETPNITWDDELYFRETSNLWMMGAPKQYTQSYDVSSLSTSTTVLSYNSSTIAQSIDGIVVFRDGVRATPSTDFTIDYFARTITVNLMVSTFRVANVDIHTFGYGGASDIVEQHLYDYAGTASITLTSTYSSNQVELVVNGNRSSNFTLGGTTLTLSPAPSTGDEIAITVYRGLASDGCHINTETLTYNSSKIWTLTYPDTQTVPEIDGTIVELNGLRLTPATDYTVSGGILTITAAVISSDVVKVTTFKNASIMKVSSYVFTPVAGGKYQGIPAPINSTYAWVTAAGKYLRNGIDFSFVYDSGLGSVILLAPISPTPSGHIVVTVFNGAFTEAPFTRLVSTLQPPNLRQVAVLDDGGWDTGFWDVSTWDQGGGPLKAFPPHHNPMTYEDPLPLYNIDSGLDDAVSNFYKRGKLSANLLPSDTSISIDVSLPFDSTAVMSNKLLIDYPIQLPNTVGAIWIEGERITYTGLSRIGNTVTLTGITRGTRRTTISRETRTVAILTGNGSTTAFTASGVGKTDVVVNLVPQSLSSNYTITTTSNTTTITFVTAPSSGATIVIGTTTGNMYPIGTSVLNATDSDINYNVA